MRCLQGVIALTATRSTEADYRPPRRGGVGRRVGNWSPTHSRRPNRIHGVQIPGQLAAVEAMVAQDCRALVSRCHSTATCLTGLQTRP